MAGLLAGTSLDPTQTAYLAALRESGEHLLNLVNDVLDLAKLESGRVVLEPVRTDVERLLQNVCELLSPRAFVAHIEIAWAAERGLPPVRADDGRLRQILFNLAGNAVKLTREGGVLLTVAAMGEPGAGRVRLRFEVKDTGPGVAPGSEARIFEEFVQTETGARAGGAGLGLAVVKRLVEAFGGEVGVHNRPKGGAAFWFEAEFEIAEGGSDAPDGCAASNALEGMTVGLVSPSAIVREAGVRQVEACGGRAVSVEALDRLPPGACAAVLVDPGPLEADGDATRLAWAPGHVPAIVLLAPEQRDRIDGYRARGFAGYLIKPLRRASLAARVLAVQDLSAERADDERAGPGLAQGLRVLLAEDNPVNALLARAHLIREGCAVDRVSTGEEALAALRAAPYDLVLMDMRMPDMDGLEATRALRARGDGTPVVALTANAFEDDRRTCLEAGMNDFLTKPLDAEALREALGRWGRRAPDAR